MNQFFQNGPKQINNTGSLSQSNSLKQAVESSLMANSQLNNQAELMQKSLSYNDYISNMQNLQINNPQMQMMNNQASLSLEQGWQNAQNEKFSNRISSETKGSITNNPIHNNIGSMNFLNMQSMPKVIHPSLNHFNEMIKNEMQQEQLNEPQNEEVNKQTEDKDKDKEMNSVYQDIINIMEDQEDERHQNSDFLKFIKKLKTGELKLNEKDNTIDKGINQDSNYEDMFNNLEETLKFNQGSFNKYNDFLPNNQFLNDKNDDIDRVEKAKELLKIFKTEEARLLLEAEVTHNKDNSQAWLLLGKIHSDLDDDDNAFKCLTTAYDQDKYNVECLFALGVQCTNSLNEFDAMINLVDYIKLHPEYHKFFDKSNTLLDYNIIKAKQAEDFDEFNYNKYEQINMMKENFYKEVIHMYDTIANNQNTKDSDFFLAYGIVNFIPHNNEQSINAFRKAVELAPDDYNCWNKLGAIYAHSSLNDLAIECYMKAISLKPDYVRCMANLALSLNSTGRKKEAATYCMKALKLFPKNTQLWFYLKSIFADMNQMEDISVCERYDINTLINKYSI